MHFSYLPYMLHDAAIWVSPPDKKNKYKIPEKSHGVKYQCNYLDILIYTSQLSN
jgi:hypothetical protein